MASLLSYFESLPDPRLERTQAHDLLDIVVIAIAAVICGADDWNTIARFGEIKKAWLSSFLTLRNGIPSHDTFNRVFSLLDADAFAKCFVNWTSSVCKFTENEIVAIDGKALRGTAELHKGKACIYLVSAWASENKLMLAQRKVAEKSNEITAIPCLLDVLALTGCIVTIDAMGCQRTIAQQLVEKQADYILAVKANQGLLFEQIQQSFQLEKPLTIDTEWDIGHGRIEKRTCSVLTNLQWVEEASKWEKLTSLVRIESHFEEKTTGKVSQDVRYYISSLAANAEKINRAVRKHWLIENALHWCLDVAFQEDNSRIRAGFASQNFALLRRIALNLLKQDTSSKLGLKNKRLAMGWDNNALAKILKI